MVPIARTLAGSADGSAYGAADGYGYGSGSGYGYGYGSGHGSGYPDGHGYGYGYGSGHGSGYPDGSGYGYGYGSGDGYGYGTGYGDGDGSGYGSGSGYGYGSAHGSGYPDGYGYGSGYGDGDGSGDGHGAGDEQGIEAYYAALAASVPGAAAAMREGAAVAVWLSDEAGRPVNGGHGDPVRAGPAQEAAGPLELCSPGTLHATHRPDRWRGARWWSVGLYPPVAVGDGKLGALSRKILGEIAGLGAPRRER